MSEMPETIWATGGHYWPDPTHKRDKTEYRRANLPPTLSAAMELPEVKALVEALESIGHMGFDMPATLDLTEDAWRRRRTSLMQQSARAALAAIKEPKT